MLPIRKKQRYQSSAGSSLVAVASRRCRYEDSRSGGSIQLDGSEAVLLAIGKQVGEGANFELWPAKAAGRSSTNTAVAARSRHNNRALGAVARIRAISSSEVLNHSYSATAGNKLGHYGHEEAGRMFKAYRGVCRRSCADTEG